LPVSRQRAGADGAGQTESSLRVLVVEDSNRLQRALCTALRANGYAVDATGDGSEAMWLIQTNPYDVIVLDIMLPGVDGMSVLSRIRARGNNVHVIFLTAKDTVEDRVRGLHAGADDYLVKPFAMDELIARVEALTRRAYGQKTHVIEVGDLRIDSQAKTVIAAGQVITRTEIEAHIYDQNAELMSNVVDSTVYALRRKIDRAGAPSIIQTRRGMGYTLQSTNEPCLPSAEK